MPKNPALKKKSRPSKKPTAKKKPAAKSKPAKKASLRDAFLLVGRDIDATHKVLDKAGVGGSTMMDRKGRDSGPVLDRVKRLSKREVQTFSALVDARAQIQSLKAEHSKAIEAAVEKLQEIVTFDPGNGLVLYGTVFAAATAALKSLAPEVEPVFDAVTPLEGPLPDGGVDSLVPASALPTPPPTGTLPGTGPTSFGQEDVGVGQEVVNAHLHPENEEEDDDDDDDDDVRAHVIEEDDDSDEEDGGVPGETDSTIDAMHDDHSGDRE